MKKIVCNKVKKKKVLVQHGAGFLSAILGPVLRTIAGAVLGN